MKIELIHPFWTAYPNAVDLFRGNPAFGTWVSRIGRIAEKIEKDPSSIPFTCDKTDANDIANRFRGDSLEGLGEILFKLQGTNPLIGVVDYIPLWTNDFGVDGKGIGLNGKLMTFQFKFRGEFDKTLTGEKDHLDNFPNQSLELGVDENDDFNMLIVTTGKGVFYKDMSVKWRNKVRYLAANESWGCFKKQKYQAQDPTNIFSLKSLLDGNFPFWNTAVKLIEGTR